MHLSLFHLACAAAVAVTLSTAAAPPANAPHHVARRSFFTLECKGVYDAAIFARLDRICDDCYNVFRSREVYTLCRHSCFSTLYFKDCVETLQETDKLEVFKQYILQIRGADP